MGSWFDSKVYERRKRNPWMTPSLVGFARDVLMNWWPDKQKDEQPVIFTIANRPDVASRLWYTLEWTAGNGVRHQVSSQEFDLLMWRAAVSELDVRDEIDAKEGGFVVSRLGDRKGDDEIYTKRIKAHYSAVEKSSTDKEVLWEVWNQTTGDTLVLVKNGASFVGG